MPFAGYEDFDDCVASNRDKDDPEAYCAVLEREAGKDAERGKAGDMTMTATANTNEETVELDIDEPEQVEADGELDSDGDTDTPNSEDTETAERKPRVNLKNLVERKNVTLELSAMDEQRTGTFKGYASTFGDVDLQGDKIMPGAYSKTIKDNGGVFVLLSQHDTDKEIGLVKASEDGNGLFVEGEFYIDPNGDPKNEVRLAREEYVKMQRRHEAGKPLQMSIGYRAINPKYKDGIRILDSIALAEVSLVTFPANPNAVTTGVKARHFQDAYMGRKPSELYARLDNAFGALMEMTDRAIFEQDMTIDELAADLDEFGSVYLDTMGRLLEMPSKTLTGLLATASVKHLGHGKRSAVTTKRDTRVSSPPKANDAADGNTDAQEILGRIRSLKVRLMADDIKQSVDH